MSQLKKFNSVAGFSVGEPGNIIDVVDNVANVYANRLFVTQYSNLGDIANVYIGGGSSGFVLKTDGTGNLTWGLDTAPAGGNTTEVQFNTGGSLDGSSAFIFNKVSNTLTITGNISTSNANLGNLAVANYLTGTLTTQEQPNITSVGTLSSVTVSGNITSGNATLGNLATANYFSGNGSLLTSLTGGNVTGQVANALVAGTVYGNVQSNITSVGTLTSVTISGLTTAIGGVKVGNIQDPAGTNTISVSSSSVDIIGNLSVGTGGSGNVTATYFIGNGSTLTSITGANVTGYVPLSTSANTAGTVTVNAQPNITSVGTLVDANISGNLLIAGNLTVNGTTEYTNVNNLYIKDPVIELGGGANNTPLTTNDGKDRGSLLHYYTTQPVDAFMGWDNSNGEFALGSNVTISSEVITFNSFGNLRAGYFIGNGSTLTSITGENVTGQVANALLAGTVYSNAQPNITSVGTLSSLTISGTGSVSGANLVSANFVTGTLTTQAQPNITSVGTLSSLTVSGLTTATGGLKTGNIQDPAGTNTISVSSTTVGIIGNLSVGTGGTGNVTATYIIGNGSALTSITGANVTGNVDQAVHAYFADVANSVTGGNVSGQVSNALVAGTVYTGAQPNITSVGTLVDANISGNLLVSGNLTVNGTTEYTNVTNLYVKDPIIEMGGGANNAPLTTNDGKDRGTLLHYYTTSPVDAFMGWDNSNGEFAFGSNVSISSEVVTFNSFGNVRAGNFIGTLSGAATTAGTVTTNAQPNITSTGTLVSLNVTGNISTAGNVIGTHYGNGYNLSDLFGSNVLGQVGNALVAGTVYSNAQPNITSVGTLTTLTVSGNVSAGYFIGNGSQLTGLPASYSNANVAAYLPTYTGNMSANYYSGNGSLLTSITGANVTGQVSNALIAGTVYSNAQPNITSVGTLSNLVVSGNTSVNGTLFANSIVGPSTANVTITAGTFISIFDEFGNITLSDNVDVVNNLYAANVLTDNLLYANGVPWNLGGTYANSNVANYLPTYSGNLSAGNVFVNNLGFGQIAISGTSSQLVGGPDLLWEFDNAALWTTRIKSNGYITTTGNVTSGNAILGNLVTANYFAGTLTTQAQPNITSLGTLVDLTVNGPVDLGSVANITITGGTSGYVLTTDGTGNLTWGAAGSGAAGLVSISKDRFLTTGSANTFSLSTTPASKNLIEVVIDGLQQISNTYSLSGTTLSFPTNPAAGQIIEVTTFGAVDLTGNIGEVQYNAGGSFGSSNTFTFNTGTNTLSVTNVTTTGNLTSQGGYVYVDTALIAVSGGNAGIFNTSVSNINLGLGSNVVIGATAGNTTIRGNLLANTASINTLSVSDYYSSRAAVTVTTDTIIDQFPVNTFRSAKYTMRVNSDAGYQAVEVLLVHNGSSSYVTIYGSISSSGSDIVSLSSNIGSGNVRLFATTSSTNTNIKILGTYVPD